MASELIKRLEGFSATVYKDVGGKLTIGYGHLVKAGESFGVISIDEAEKLLDNDMKIAQKAVDAYVRVPLTENQKAALVSFVYNVGVGAFASSTLLSNLNDENYIGAANQFDRWVNAGGIKSAGLVNRRAAEKELFLRG